MKLSRLCSALDGLEGVRVFDFQERDITGIAYDSRKVRPGYLFVAVLLPETAKRRYSC